jgi:hypothetical protein
MLSSDPEKVRAWQQRSRSNLPRTPLAAGRKPIPPRSPRKTARWEAIATASVSALVRDGYRCQAAGLAPGDCDGPLDPHHLFPRLVRPDLVAVSDAIFVACRLHHSWIDANPDAANVAGLHGFSGDTLAVLAERRQNTPGTPVAPSERFR